MNIKQWLQDVLRATFSLKESEDTLAHLEHMHRMPHPKPILKPKKKPKARKRASKAKKLKRAA